MTSGGWSPDWIKANESQEHNGADRVLPDLPGHSKKKPVAARPPAGPAGLRKCTGLHLRTGSGTRVHKSGRPFTDPSGDRLRDWMGIGSDVFYDPEKLAIVPMGFCFPGLDAKGGDLPPRSECRLAWHDQVFEAMPQIELVLAIGQYAQAYHLGASRKRSLTETVSAWKDYFTLGADVGRPAILPLPHPSWRNNAWLKKNPWFETDLLPVLRREVARLVA
jgi:uracil-DNA glycosylase